MADEAELDKKKDGPGTAIVIGVLVWAITAFLAFLFGQFTGKPVPPVAKLVPQQVTVRADEPAQFDASASTSPDGGNLSYAWMVGGQPIATSPIASCSLPNGDQLLECRFVVPGTYGVSASVTAKNGLSQTASSSATVVIEGGYATLRVLHGGTKRDKMLRELLYGVDWLKIQEVSTRIIVLWDPDSKRYVYPVSFEGIAEERKLARPTGVLAGAKIAGAFFGKTGRALRRALEPYGVVFVQIPGGGSGLPDALRSGIAEIGFISIDDPTAAPPE